MHRRWRWLVPLLALIAFTFTRAGAAADIPSPAGAEARVDKATQIATLAALVARKERSRAKARAAADESRAVLRAATAQIGDAYAFGGGGPDAFDCSGLTRYAFASADIELPHDSHGQAALGRPVARDEIREGDLVFFSTAGAGASHVGIATGPTTVVSATNSGVLEHSTQDAYWGGHYVTARRVL